MHFVVPLHVSLPFYYSSFLSLCQSASKYCLIFSHALWYFDNRLLPHVQTLQLSAVKAQQIDFILYIRSKIANHSGTLIPHSCQTFPFCVGLHGTLALTILQGQNDVCAGWRVQGSLWLPSGLQGSSVLIDFDHWLEVNIVLNNWKTREPANRALPGKADVFKLQTFNKCWNKHLKTPNSQQKGWVFNFRLSQQYRNVFVFFSCSCCDIHWIWMVWSIN